MKDWSSHLHWDHVGEPTDFPSAEIILGSDARVLLKDAYPDNPTSTIPALPLAQRTIFIEFVAAQAGYPVISPFLTFDRAIDFFSDGSLYLIDTPGHMPGHLSALARVAPSTFVLLAGDVCHNRTCYNPGERIVSEKNHEDVELARRTVARLTKVGEGIHNVVIVLAHEAEREKEMPMFPESLNEWAGKEVERRDAKHLEERQNA